MMISPSLNRPMRALTCAVLLAALLAGCGRSDRAPRVSSDGGFVTRSASGPIASACLVSGRRDASPALCGCVQAAANLTLSPDDQRRSSRYFSEPDLLQEVKVSDSVKNEAFWDRWIAFRDRANSMCTGV